LRAIEWCVWRNGKATCRWSLTRLSVKNGHFGRPKTLSPEKGHGSCSRERSEVSPYNCWQLIGNLISKQYTNFKRFRIQATCARSAESLAGRGGTGSTGRVFGWASTGCHLVRFACSGARWIEDIDYCMETFQTPSLRQSVVRYSRWKAEQEAMKLLARWRNLRTDST